MGEKEKIIGDGAIFPRFTPTAKLALKNDEKVEGNCKKKGRKIINKQHLF